MKKKYRLENLDCANCAAKMESAIKKLPGVRDASVSFLTQRLTVDAEDACFDEVLAQAVRVCRKIEPECRILL
jgi:copper chaperone CopZ